MLFVAWCGCFLWSSQTSEISLCGQRRLCRTLTPQYTSHGALHPTGETAHHMNTGSTHSPPCLFAHPRCRCCAACRDALRPLFAANAMSASTIVGTQNNNGTISAVATHKGLSHALLHLCTVLLWRSIDCRRRINVQCNQQQPTACPSRLCVIVLRPPQTCSCVCFSLFASPRQ